MITTIRIRRPTEKWGAWVIETRQRPSEWTHRGVRIWSIAGRDLRIAIEQWRYARRSGALDRRMAPDPAEGTVIDYIVNEMVPLTRTELDGTKADALCWKIDRVFHVHPDRLDGFEHLMREAGIAARRVWRVEVRCPR